MALRNMKGWRRPHLVRKVSDHCPTIGSDMASTQSATSIAKDTSSALIPMT